ncbi:metallophosphoesterase [Clostridium frigidicarnis]|uniref:Phosphoesterase n=1 Tax=Clostridium frigidicarnis TaxID=84698 RepID=A0A1I1B4E7_9CLOT|nr:metallophosphoesterase [Clostridium frigidicarnis]SFB45215.1 hypothetical protein SAMN04488528_106411 [Clostridium frigidicarnis]
MVIAVVSDTHRQASSILKAVEEAKNAKVDMLIHLGDNVADIKLIKECFNKDIVFVKGNCDFESYVKSEKVLKINGVNIFITHGHEYNVEYNLLNLKLKALELGAQVALYGHSHVAMIERDSNIIMVNPGSTSLPRGQNKSMAFIEIDEKSNIEINIKKLD